MAETAKQKDPVYDDDSGKPITRPDLRSAEERGGFYNPGDKSDTFTEQGVDNPDDLKKSEASSGAGTSGFYNAQGGGQRTLSSRLKNRKKWLFGAALVSAIVASILGLFISFGRFNLSTFMASIEQRGFARYQVDLNGRSSKWLETYMMLRFGEIDDPRLAPKDRDNILFRSSRVDNNKPLTDWYRTLRASNFEKEVFEKHGIKFASIAYRDGNIIKFRPAKITINDETISVLEKKGIPFSDISLNEIDTLSTADVNKLNGRLQDAVRIEKLDGDKAGRQAISKVVREEYPGWWRAIKRYHLRHDIQNMVGVRKWRFFENKRTALKESVQARRNAIVQKVVDQTLPEDSKSGKFIECLFGLANCNASSDVANPDNNQLAPDGTQKEADKTTTNPDGTTNDITDGTGTSTLQTGSEAAAASGKALREAIPKLFKGASIASLLDSLAKFDNSVRNHSLSKLVAQAKLQYVVGLYTTFKIADDQFKTGEMSSQELSDFENQYGNLNNSDAGVLINGNLDSSTVSADSTTFAPAKDKKEFCSEQHQAEMAKPENQQAAENEHQYNCAKDQIGGQNNASILENAWNNGPGAVLHPILSAYDSAAGGILGVLNSVTGAITNAVLSITGLGDKIQSVASYGAEKAIEYGGANLNINTQTPSGRVGNLLLEGSGGLAESTARDQGAAATTGTTRALATSRYIAYQKQESLNMSFKNKYLASSNPSSLLSKEASALGGLKVGGLFSSFGDIFSNSLKSFSLPVNAATQSNNSDDGYEVARFAQIDTYDFPKECLDTDPIDMTPQNSTNADDLGIFQSSELNWDMMSNKETWYKALYDKLGSSGISTGDKEKIAKQVYNCALLDNTVRGGIGALYGYKGEDAYSN